MKDGWTTKRMSEVFELQMGKTPSRDNLSYWNGSESWVSISDMGSSKYISSTKERITKAAIVGSGIKQVPKGCVIMSFKLSVGKVAIAEKDLYTNEAIMAFKQNNESVIKSDYIYYYLKGYKWDGVNRAAMGLTLNKATISNGLFSFPSLEVQEQIVTELDLLTDIIDKQKTQLKELDTLAQSIFYDMFGDPVVNDRGWNVERLSNVSTLLNGRAYSQNELLDEGKYKVLRVGNFFTNGNYYYSNLELEDDKYCYNGDLLFAWSASFGAFIWDGDKTIYHYHIWKVLFDKGLLNIHYYRFLLNAMTSSFMKDVHGIGMVHLTKAGMEQYELPVPPIELQESFAQKIQFIESQKEAINRSITETQKLFDYTMDKYFG